MIDDIDDIAAHDGEDPQKEDLRLDQHQLEHDLTWRYLNQHLPTQGSLLWQETGVPIMARRSQYSGRLLSFSVFFILLVFGLGSDGVFASQAPESSPAFVPDTLVSYVCIYADAEGESHFEDVNVELSLIEVAPGISPLFASSFSEASRYAFLSAKPGWREDWHPAPQRQFLVYLAGVTEFRVSDGEIRRLGPGTILLAEDTVGKGHISEVVGEADVTAVIIQLAGGG